MSAAYDTPGALALRALQKLDEADRIESRHLLIEAETQLGVALGLKCTGVFDPDDGEHGCYQHDDGTCPIHEWLLPEDQAELLEPPRAITSDDDLAGTADHNRITPA